MRIHIALICFLASASGLLATAPPTIDGRLDDPFWSLRSRVWNAQDHRLPDNRARFHLGFDDDYLYFAADVIDADVTGTHTGRKDQVWLDDTVEIFIDFGNGTAADRTPETFEYGFSVAGGVNWTRGTGDGSGDNFPAHDYPAAWDSAVESVVHLKEGTTLNQRDDRDAGFTIEARIPWSELGQKPPISPDRLIGVNFLNICRPELERTGDRPLSTLPNIDFTNNHTPQLWQRIRMNWQGPLPIRGTVESFPLWLGTSLYSSQWKMYESAETDPDGLWFDRKRWTGKLDQMRSMQLNALLLTHPHPYPGLLALKDYPGACYFSEDRLVKHQDQLKWLLAEAKARGIQVYLMTWNVCLPPKWARSQGLEEFGSDTPLAREYTRKAVVELFWTYPQLAGLATMAGEHPPGCIDFVVDAIAGGLGEVAGKRVDTYDPVPDPKLIFWSWCSYPEDARRVLDAFPHTRLMHYLQYEQWFKPMVDPRVPRFETAAIAAKSPAPIDPVSTITLGGPKSALGYLFWGDPEWMRTLAIDLRQQGTAGIFFEPYCAESWLATEALAAYAIYPGERFTPGHWTNRLDEVYGVGKYAGQLLETMQHAGAIVPCFLRLMHSQSDHFMPQFGIPLTHYLEMPTLSTYVFENTQATDDRGYLTPRLGLAWPNPDWGEQVVGIRDFVRGTAPPDATTPKAIANEINLHVITCQSRLHGLRNLKPADPDQARRLSNLLGRIELNVALGEHFHHKIKAAIGWEQLRLSRGSITDCTRPLGQSVRAWRKVVEIAERLYPEPVRHWQSQIVSAPPWTQNEIWNSYRLIEGHWRNQLPRFEREFSFVQQILSTKSAAQCPPLWDTLCAEPYDNLESIGRFGFEIDLEQDQRLRLSDGGTITTDLALVVRESKALLADTRGLDGDVHVVMTTDPGHAPLESHRPFQIILAYRVIDRGSGLRDPFEIGVRPADGGEPLGDHRFWGGPAGHIGTRMLKIPPLKRENYVFYVAVHGQAAIVIDQIDVQALMSY